MQEITDQLLAWYAEDPLRALLVLLLVGIAMLILLLGLVLWQIVQGRKLAEMDGALHAQANRLAESVQDALQSQLDSTQRSLQVLQMVLNDKINSVQHAFHKEAALTRSELMERIAAQTQVVHQALSELRLTQQSELAELRQSSTRSLGEHRELFERRQQEAVSQQQQTLVTTLGELGRQVQERFQESSKQLGERMDALNRTTDERLREITGQVEKRLSEGFEKTTETFTRVLEHLTRIDEAQKRITELSGNVVSLQEVLTDKRSRGAFGEVQLTALVRNVMPEGSYQEQATLSNGRRVDCLLRLPDPTGDVPIDSKFPLESYQRMVDFELPETERKSAAAQFKRDIRKHIHDIADRYLIAGETSDGAVMFIPAEAIFAEIHAKFTDLVEEAQRARVWMVSPTTLMAVLTTARSVLKDDATRKQVHVIQDHLRKLSVDFDRFRQRMDKLATHIRQAKEDVDQVHTSARKISSRFQSIEQVELPEVEESVEQARQEVLELKK